MSKTSDVRWGRRGGRNIPAGVEPGTALADIAKAREEAQREGTWPSGDADDDRAECDGQLDLFEVTEIDMLRADNERLRALLAKVLVADTWDEIREISAVIRSGQESDA